MHHKNIVWFKRNLRIHDNEPLMQACKAGNVIPLYIIEPTLWTLPDSSRRHWHFIHDCLIDLQTDLSALGMPLIIRIGEACNVLSDLYSQIGDFTLWSHEETGNNWTYQRDISVKKWCDENTILWHEYQTNGIIRRLKNRDDWATNRDLYMAFPLIPTPVSGQSVQHINSYDLPPKNHALFGGYNIGTVQTGGRMEGIKTLNSFLRERGRNYMQTISKPGISARHCSRLSTHITYGTVSVREIEQATKAKIITLGGNTDTDAVFFRRNLTAFLSRLAWHCHFIQKLEQQPNIEFKAMHPIFENIRTPFFREDFFECWKTGHTGYPLIDACMRSLHENGWITFRMRAMLVSFASYDLWLDWRKTAPFLAGLFTDYEAGIHYSQFQMQSGTTGINTVRIYNPIKQSYDHDPQGKFIRRYIPELKNVPDSFIHEPWLFENIKTDYPQPIIQHESAIKFARTKISECRKSNDFKDISQVINKKLGSRNRPVKNRTNKPTENTQQISWDF